MELWNGLSKRREIGAAKEKWIGFLMAGGLVITILFVGLIGIQVLIGLSKTTAPDHPSGPQTGLDFFHFTLWGAVVGTFMVVGGLAFGIYSERTQHQGPQQTEPNFRVLSRLCLDKNFQLLISDIDIEYAKKPKFYIRGMLQNGMVGEFQTSREVFYNSGEGMTGEAEIQGKWLGKFVPYIGESAGVSAEFVVRV